MYDPSKQYRCTIIRGKSQKEMDDLLPAYAKVIDEICPCSHQDFETLFNEAFKRYLPESERIKKTLDNHRTEISGKLFGMYYFAEDGMVYESERTQKYLEDNDQPAFFKDICFKMQFPNGMQKVSTTVAKRVEDEISVRPNAFVLKLLQIAQTAGVTITKKALGYYVLNSLDVLQGHANPNESEAISLFTSVYKDKPEFDVYEYDLGNAEIRKEFQFKWDAYYARLSQYAQNFKTSSVALLFEEKKSIEETKKSRVNLTEFGDEGETLVYNYEKSRVAAYNTRLANKVLSLGKTRGIGYDIQSVIAEPGDEAEFVKYIEVKSTKRLTSPDLSDPLWVDSLNITRNEWIAAQQHKEYYAIYRVFFTREGATVFVINNVAEKIKDGRIQVTPMTYRVDFSNSSVDKEIPIRNEES